MVLFWVVTGVLSAAAAGLILQRAAKAASMSGPVDPTLGLYRRQLGEIDDLARRGLLAEGERRSAHAEAARRLLNAADQPASAWSSQIPVRRVLLAAAVLAPALAMGLYLAAGSPGMADQPFAARLQAWRSADPRTLDAPQMAVVVEALAKERPGDPEAQRYLGLARAAADDPAGAVRALRKAIALAPQRADLWESLGEAAMMEAGGEVAPQAAVAFGEALKRDPKAMGARFQLARAKVEAGDKAGGVADWRALLADMPPADPRRAAVQAAISMVEDGPPAAPPVQPDAIRAMVESLAARLHAQPDDPQGWVRLVRSYAVLGEADKRDEALKAAQVRYAAEPQVLDALKAAAAAEPLR